MEKKFEVFNKQAYLQKGEVLRWVEKTKPEGILEEKEKLKMEILFFFRACFLPFFHRVLGHTRG